MTVNPKMLTLARESRGLSQCELASRIEVTQGKLSKYENGLLTVSSDDLSAISRELDYEQEFFQQTDQIHGLGSSFLFNRSRKTLPVTVQRRIVAQINVAKMQIERLLAGAEIDCDERFFKCDPDSVGGNVESIAEYTRAAWSLPPGPIDDLTTAIESAGGIVVHCHFGTEQLDATHMWLPGLPPLFFVNTDMPGDRLRFTLAHEVGHAVMHALPNTDVETEADRFAGELLMPADEIGPELVGLTINRAAQLKLQWKVSMQALIVRARHLGRITPQRYRKLYTELSALGYRRHEPYEIPVEKPTVMPNLIDLHWRYYGYTTNDLKRLLFTTTGLLRTSNEKHQDSLPMHLRILRPDDDNTDYRVG